MYTPDGLYARDEIRFVTVRHEQVAVSMADGYARVTGRQGVCLTTGGPGAANSIIGMTIAAVSGRSGPVHIDLPLNLQDVEVKYTEHPPAKAGRNRLAPSNEEVSRANGPILESGRPVIFAGGGVIAPI